MAEGVGQIFAREIAARKKDAFAREVGGKFFGESQTLMLCGDAAYRHAGAASGLRGDRTYGSDANSVERIHNVNAERLRSIEQGANGVGAGDEEPVEGAQVAKRFV
jgi:hypothetical protein